MRNAERGIRNPESHTSGHSPNHYYRELVADLAAGP